MCFFPLSERTWHTSYKCWSYCWFSFIWTQWGKTITLHDFNVDFPLSERTWNTRYKFWSWFCFTFLQVIANFPLSERSGDNNYSSWYESGFSFIWSFEVIVDFAISEHSGGKPQLPLLNLVFIFLYLNVLGKQMRLYRRPVMCRGIFK